MYSTTKKKGFLIMNAYKSTRHAKFLLNYHFIWIPKYRKHILDNPKIKHLILDTSNELANTHDFEVLATEIMADHIHFFYLICLSILPVS